MLFRKNILFIIYRLYGGGAERVVSNLSMALGDKYNVKITIYDIEEKTYPYKGELIRIKLPFSKDPVPDHQEAHRKAGRGLDFEFTTQGRAAASDAGYYGRGSQRGSIRRAETRG